MPDPIQQRQLIDTAYQRIPPKIGVPSLCRHMAFWCPVPEHKGHLPTNSFKEDRIDEYLIQTLLPRIYQEDPNFSVIRRIYPTDRNGRLIATHTRPDDFRIDLFSHSIFKSDILPGNATQAPRRPPRINTKRDDHDSIVFEFGWRGLRTELKFTLHTEYITVSASVDCSTIYTIKQTTDAAAYTTRIEPLRTDLRDSISHIATYHDNTGNYLRASHAYLYDTFWDLQFFGAIFDASAFFSFINAPIRVSIQGDDVDHQICTSFFLDFRRVILGIDEDTPEPLPDHFALRRPFWRTVHRFGDYIDDEIPFPLSDVEWRRVFHRFEPFLTSNHFALPYNEFAVSAFLNGTVMHVSTLGQSSVPDVEEPLPAITYSFLFSTSFRLREIGKLVDELNRAGTCRHAASMEMDKLHDVGIKHRELYRELKNIRSNPTMRFDNDDIERINVDLSILEKEPPSGLEPFEVSFAYRIARTRHYISKCRSIIKQLHPMKIAGLPNLEELIDYRFNDTFAHAEKMSNRYDFIKSEIPSLQGLNMVSKITALQQNAEIFFFFVLAPYYLGSIIVEHIFSPLITSVVERGLDHTIDHGVTSSSTSTDILNSLLAIVSAHIESEDYRERTKELIEACGWFAIVMLCWLYSYRLAEEYRQEWYLKFMKMIREAFTLRSLSNFSLFLVLIADLGFVAILLYNLLVYGKG